MKRKSSFILAAVLVSTILISLTLASFRSERNYLYVGYFIYNSDLRVNVYVNPANDNEVIYGGIGAVGQNLFSATGSYSSPGNGEVGGGTVSNFNGTYNGNQIQYSGALTYP